MCQSSSANFSSIRFKKTRAEDIDAFIFDSFNQSPLQDAQSDSTKDNLAYIIIGVVILVILIVLLIGCLIFRRHNRDKGVRNVLGQWAIIYG